MTTTNVDTDVLYSTLADDPVLGELVQLYAAEMPDRVAAIVGRYEARDYAGLATLAHQMKGAAGSHGFHPLTPFAARLEKLARDAQAENEIRQAVDALVEACGRVRRR